MHKQKEKEADNKGKNKEESKDGKDKPTGKGVKCYVCNKNGHITSNCPLKKKLLEKNDDSSSISSKSSKKEELEKIIKSVNKQFIQLLKSHAEDADDDEEPDADHSNFQFIQHDTQYDLLMKQ